MAKNNMTNIQVYKRKWNLNIGVLIFGIVFVYLIIIILGSLTNRSVSTYEVRMGSILKEVSYTGLVLRQEEVVQTGEDGYVNYLIPEGSKVGVKTKVYALSEHKLQFEQPQSESQSLSREEQYSVFMKVQEFGNSFKPEKFSDVYTLKDQLTTLLTDQSSLSRQAQLDAMAETEALKTYTATSDGIILYSTDGYEDISEDNLSKEMLSKEKYQAEILKDNTSVKAGNAVYKLVKDDDWKVCIPLDKKIAKELKERSYVKVRFSADGQTMWARVKVQEKKDGVTGILNFDTSMVAYAKERYLNIDLILEDETGLKVPKSAVTKKTYYAIPRDYLTQGGNSQLSGVLKDIGKDSVKFIPAGSYYADEEAGKIYIDSDLFDKGDVLKKPDSSDTFTLKETELLTGVYNVNRGYASFRQVKVLCESEDYYIVEPTTLHGLSNYDHIALHGKDMKENKVIF